MTKERKKPMDKEISVNYLKLKINRWFDPFSFVMKFPCTLISGHVTFKPLFPSFKRIILYYIPFFIGALSLPYRSLDHSKNWLRPRDENLLLRLSEATKTSWKVCLFLISLNQKNCLFFLAIAIFNWYFSKQSTTVAIAMESFQYSYSWENARRPSRRSLNQAIKYLPTVDHFAKWMYLAVNPSVVMVTSLRTPFI